MIFSNLITSISQSAAADNQQQPPLLSNASLAPSSGLLENASSKLRQLVKMSSTKFGRKQDSQSAHLQQPANVQQAPVAQNKSAVASTPKQQPQQQPQQQQEQQCAEWQLSRKFTLCEVAQHSSLDDCWLVIFDKVYDISDFVFQHPGGDFILLEYAGRDATQAFLSSRHGSSAYKMLDGFWIGILVDEDLCYSNSSSYCSVYSNLSWRNKAKDAQKPQPEAAQQQSPPKPPSDEEDATSILTTTPVSSGFSSADVSPSAISDSKHSSLDALSSDDPDSDSDSDSNSDSDPISDDSQSPALRDTSAAIAISQRQSRQPHLRHAHQFDLYTTSPALRNARPSRRYYRSPTTSSTQNLLNIAHNNYSQPRDSLASACDLHEQLFYAWDNQFGLAIDF